MHSILANTIWAPLFVYFYDWQSALASTAVGFTAEVGIFRLYTRAFLSTAVIFRRLVAANLVSYVAGVFLMAFVPLDIKKASLADTVLAFFIAYIITISVELRILRSLLPTNRLLLFRAVAMANFISYAILFTGYFVWFTDWPFR